MNKDEQVEWDEWVTSRPEIVQKLCRQLPPNKLYRMKKTGHIVTIYSYAEDGTVKVNITGEHNPGLLFERRVFGVKPENLEEIPVVFHSESV